MDPRGSSETRAESTTNCIPVSTSPSGSSTSRPCSAVCVSDPQLLSRILYPNPVSLLSVAVPQEDTNSTQRPRFNVMVITWLTPVDNAANIFLSMNRTRYSASLLSAGSIFVLNIPTASMEEQVLKIGKCSGRDVDKFDALSVATCEPGWCSDRSQYEYMMPPKVFRKYRDISPHIAISACVAHIVCKLHKIEAQENDGGHLFLFAEMLYAFVRPQYWNGKCFIGPCPKEVATQLDNPSGASQGKNAEAEPLLTFLGSGRFAHMVMPPESVGH